MEIIIQDSSKLSEIQAIFNKYFPYLKLEFFNVDQPKDKLFAKENLITNTDITLAEVRQMHQSGHLNINGNQKVSTLEKHCREIFGINIQVFRKSGKAWLQTTASDDWTLSEQNKIAEELSTILPTDEIETDDQYHEQP